MEFRQERLTDFEREHLILLVRYPILSGDAFPPDQAHVRIARKALSGPQDQDVFALCPLVEGLENCLTAVAGDQPHANPFRETRYCECGMMQHGFLCQLRIEAEDTRLIFVND